MNERRSLEGLLRVLEMVHLSVLTCCLSIPLVFFLPEYSDLQQLLWGLGAIVPVMAIQLPCQHLEKRLHRLFVGLGVFALTMVLCPTNILRVAYGLCISLQILICTALAKPGGKFVLTVPKVYHAPAPLLLYGLSRALDNRVLIIAAVTIAVVFVVNLLLYLQARKLLLELYDNNAAAVSVSGIVSVNRRLMLVFCVIGAALIVAVPLLLSRQPQQQSTEAPAAEAFVSETKAHAEEEPVPLETKTVPEGTPYNLDFISDVFVVVFLVFLGLVLVLWGIAIVFSLRSISNDKDLHNSSLIIEALPEEQPKRSLFDGLHDRSWQGRLRRLYPKLIHAKTDRDASLQALTPRELERAACLEGPARDTLHTLYEKARYSGAACDKADYLSAKAAAQQLRSR